MRVGSCYTFFMLRNDQNKRVLSLSLCLTVLAALFLLLLARAPYGFDWTDETYYSVLPYRFVLGDRPILDTWEVHQFSGLIALPFMRLYLLITAGDMTGVMLYFRYVFLVIQFLIAVYAFFVLRRQIGNVPAMLGAGLFLMHTHYGINSFYYNTMALMFLVLSALLLFDAEDAGKPRLRNALAGLSYALSVLAYPYLLLALPVYLVYWALRIRRAKGEAHRLRPAAWFVSGGIVAAAAVCIYIVSRSSVGEVIANFGYLLTDPDHESIRVLDVMLSYLNATRVLFGPTCYAAAALCAYGFATCFVRNPKKQANLRAYGLMAAVAVIAMGVIWVIPYDYPNIHKINLAAMTVALVAPALYFLSGRKPGRGILLFFLGTALSVAVQIGSNTRIRASSGMMLPASVGALMYLFQCLDDLPDAAKKRMLKTFATVVCSAQLLLTAGLRMMTVYRDAPIEQLTATIADGPAKGIRTTPAHAAHLEDVCSAFLSHAPAEGTVLVSYLFPYAYLLTNLPPATPSTYNMPLQSPWLMQYYALHPERKATYVFVLSDNPGSDSSAAYYADGLAQLTADTRYTVTELPVGAFSVIDGVIE